jgi:hypothetical protein
MYQWSTTAGNNASAGLIDWAEGQPPSTVNDSARQMMADVAAWYQSPEWLNYGLTPTFVSGTQFTVAGNQTSTFSVGRRVRMSVTAGTIFGTITASAYTSLTTVTVSVDSGAIDSGLSEVDVGILNPLATSIPVGTTPNYASITLSGAAGTNRAVFMQTAGVQRWFAGADSTSESGSNAGSNYGITRYADNGSAIDTPMSISRANGNVTFANNVTYNSDERLKTDWESLPPDFIDRLAGVLSGTYTRIDGDGSRHTGVGAGSLREVLPEAVLESSQGILSVAYGNAALVACIELAKEVVRLRALVESK